MSDAEPLEMAEPHDLEVSPAVVAAATTLVLDAVAAEVATALGAAGAESILLKGPSIVRALYSDVGERTYADVDLLIDPRRLDRARDVVRGLGFEPLATPVIDGRLDRHSEPWKRRRDFAFLDVHATLPWLGVPPETAWDVLRGETEPIVVGGAELEAFAPAALALHVALHAAYHGRDVEETRRDLELALARWPYGIWRAGRALAERLEALSALRAGLSVVPEGKHLAGELELPRRLPPEVGLSALGPRGAVELERLLARGRWRDRVRLVARQAFPPRAFIEAWSPAAQDSRRHLALAYARRLAVIAARLPAALVAVARARGRGASRPAVPARQQPPSESATSAPGSRPAVVSIAGLSRSFGGRTVVTQLGLEVEAGERIALWGPNGSGKTTILRCIAGSLAPTRGTITVGGHEAGSLEARGLIGVSFSQERSFYLRLSGRNNLLFFARLRHASERDAVGAVDSLERELDLTEILRTRADACSAGMLQQLGLARALLGDPAVLLLDEPTRSLDAAAVERLWAALERRPYTAVLLATHHVDDAERCDRRVDLPT